jgi:hypothetical protein
MIVMAGPARWCLARASQKTKTPRVMPAQKCKGLSKMDPFDTCIHSTLASRRFALLHIRLLEVGIEARDRVTMEKEGLSEAPPEPSPSIDNRAWLMHVGSRV